jgi:DNA polymerase elongation subunit (family B)
MATNLFIDTECYPNYFLLMLKLPDGKKRYFELDETHKLDTETIAKFFKERLTIGFNSLMYDIPMILYALRGKNNAELKELSDRLISKEEKSFDVISKLSLWCPSYFDHIDIFKIPAGKASLKMYGARIHAPFLQDLPYDPSKPVTEEQKEELKKYCSNDIDLTIKLFNSLEEQLLIRLNINKEYDIDVRSKGDAGIAEMLMLKSLGINKKNVILPKQCEFQYELPSYIDFKSDNLQELLSTVTSLTFKCKLVKNTSGEQKWENNFKDGMPNKININGNSYSFGIGGLHSQEQHRSIVCKDDELLIDVDVTGHYPKMIIDNKWSPEHLDKDKFNTLITNFYNDRVVAKRDGNKAKSDTYKIILNSTYGKFGDCNSFLYSPKCMLHTTLTGQLSLLMLIEMLEECGLNVVSANTDGILVYIVKADYQLFQSVCEDWQEISNLNLEETKYKALYNESVNSYIAVKEDGSLKRKGSFVEGDLAHNPTIKVCMDAVINYLLEGKSIEETILNYDTDPRNFLMVRKVVTGGYWREKYLGKIVRWYWSTTGEPIYRRLETMELKKDGTAKTDPKVAGSDDAFPIMDLNDGLVNINYEKYINEAYEMLKNIGVKTFLLG